MLLITKKGHLNLTKITLNPSSRHNDSVLPCAKIDTSIFRYSKSHIFSTDAMIIGRFHISEVRIRSPYSRTKFGGIQSSVKYFILSMGKPRVLPPLPEEDVYCVILELMNPEIRKHK